MAQNIAGDACQARRFPATTDPRAGSPCGRQLLRRADVCKIFAISRSTLHRWVRDDPSFPQPQRFAGSTIRWREDEVVAYIANCPRVEYEDHSFDPNAVFEGPDGGSDDGR